MTSDLARFRELIGVLPDARLSLLRSLFNGPSSLDDLVRVSALPRRDVQDFLASLDGIELDENEQRYLLGASSRGGYQQLLDEFAERRPLLSPGDEDELRRVAERLIGSVPAPRRRFDHVQATPGTVLRRVKWLTENFDLSSRSVLFVGDHDLTSLLLAHVVADAKLTVVDIDERLLAYIEDRAEDASLAGRIDCVFADLRFGLPPALAESAEVVFTDPPYTAEGLSLFLSRSLASLNRQSLDNRVVIAFGHSRRRPDLGLAAQREISRLETVIDCMLPNFNSYFGAQAVGSSSDLYSCQPTPRAFRRIDQEARSDVSHGIYTRGENSVESPAPSAAEMLKLLPQLAWSGTAWSGTTWAGTADPAWAGTADPAWSGTADPAWSGTADPAWSGTADPRTVGLIAIDPGPAQEFGVVVGLGRLLETGVHPSVTRRAGEFVVDLRDDPGPWLMRSLLALNAGRVTCVLRKPHEDLDELTGGSAAWDLVRAKFSSFGVRELPGPGLVTVRCELAGAQAGQRELELARFVLQRAHGRLRNVWREGLIEIAQRAERTMTKREALDVIESHIGSYGNDLALRLIDVPAHHFGALRRAFANSAAGLTGD